MERKHRHLLNVGRVLRFQANLSLKFWGESIKTTCYLINRLPTPLLFQKSPYEILHGRSQSYSHIRVFGCLCYATNLTPTHKFDIRAHQCIFVGYPLCQKGYQVYDLDTKKFLTSRDVVFHEHTFPFSTSPPENQNDYPVLPIPLDGITPSLPFNSQPISPSQAHILAHSSTLNPSPDSHDSISPEVMATIPPIIVKSLDTQSPSPIDIPPSVDILVTLESTPIPPQNQPFLSF